MFWMQSLQIVKAWQTAQLEHMEILFAFFTYSLLIHFYNSITSYMISLQTMIQNNTKSCFSFRQGVAYFVKLLIELKLANLTMTFDCCTRNKSRMS